MPELELGFPWAFTLLAAPILVWWLFPPYREREESIRVPFFEQLAAAAGREPSRGGVLLKRNVFQKLLAPVAWLVLLTAMARPQLVEPPIEKVESARDLMLAIDLSGSMDTSDMFDEAGARITRIDMVKGVLADFVERREGDRLGVIVFGNEAFLQAPFTRDHELVRTLIDQVEPRMAGPQTMLGDAIGLTIKAFDATEARDRVLVLLTDGNDTGSRVPPNKAADIAAEKGITVYPVAVGDPTTAGEAEMDMEALEGIARATGGTAYFAGDREALEEVYREIDALTPEEIETLSYRPTRPLYQWPLGLFVALLLFYHAVMGLTVMLRELGARRA